MEPSPAPTLSSPEWPIPDRQTILFTYRKLENDIHNAMKCTYGSHRATLTLFIPLHLFVYLFHTGEVHRTPTMWITKGGLALSQVLSRAWDTKVSLHNGDTIRCMVVAEKMVIRYHIAKQQLCIVFPYRRWKLTKGAWEALDSDTASTEQVELQICRQDDDVLDIAVNDDWSLLNLREYLALRFALRGEYAFAVDGKTVRKRKESSTLCKDLSFPRCLFVQQSP